MMKSGALALSIGVLASLAGSVQGAPPPMDSAISTSDSMTRSRAEIMSYSDGFGVFESAEVDGGDEYNPTSAETYVSGDNARALARGSSSGSALAYHEEVRANAFLEEYTQSLAEMDLTEVEAENSGEAYLYVNRQGDTFGTGESSVTSYVAARAEEEGSSLSELAQDINILTEDTFSADRGSYGWSDWLTDLVVGVESNEADQSYGK